MPAPWFFQDVQPLTPQYGCICWIGLRQVSERAGPWSRENHVLGGYPAVSSAIRVCQRSVKSRRCSESVAMRCSWLRMEARERPKRNVPGYSSGFHVWTPPAHPARVLGWALRLSPPSPPGDREARKPRRASPAACELRCVSLVRIDRFSLSAPMGALGTTASPQGAPRRGRPLLSTDGDSRRLRDPVLIASGGRTTLSNVPMNQRMLLDDTHRRG